nr:hypothetical protein [Tanacetum cinerariifolium]
MHKAFPLLVRKFPLPEGISHCLKMNATVRRIEMPLPKVCTAIKEKKKKLPVEDFIPMGSKEETERLKRKGLNLDKEQMKKQKSSEEAPEIETSTKEFTEKKMKEMMQLVPVEDVYVQALQVKHPSLPGREHLNQLWALVKEYLSIRPATNDKEIELWVEFKRMYEPDPEDQLWTLTQNFMHAPVEWKLYDLSGVHHLTAKDKEIFMIVEKDCPLRKGLALVMISYKLQVESYSQMAEDLIRKIYNIANTPRQQDLRVLFQSIADADAYSFWRNQDSWRIGSWSLYPRAHVYVLETMDRRVIYMFVDVSYPLNAATLERMLKHGLEVPKLLVGGDLTMAEQLVCFIKAELLNAPSAIRSMVTQNWMVFTLHVLFWNKKWLVQGGTTLVQEQMTLGKDNLNPLTVDSLLKTIWSSIHHLLTNEVLTSPEQTATGKDVSNLFMAMMVYQKPLGYFSSPMIHVPRAGLVINPPGYVVPAGRLCSHSCCWVSAGKHSFCCQ